MSDGPFQFPVSGQVDPELLAGLRALVDALKETKGKAAEAGESSSSLATRFNAIVTAARTVLGTLPALTERMTALADEQARLDEVGARLGLDFDEAAASAGRFADETEAMHSASVLAQAGIRLTQQELNALERVAGAASRTLGVTTKEATDRLTEALRKGEAEGLRAFGGELARVAEGGSTAAERLRALVTQAEHTEQATDSAADAQARFRDSLEDSERVFATAFVSGLARLAQVGEGADTASERLSNMRTEIAAAGDAAAEVVARVGNGIGVVIGFLGTGVGTVLAGVQSIAAALQAVTAGNIRGAGAAAQAELDRAMRDGLAGTAFNFMRDRISRLNALAENDDGRTSMTAPGATADMVFTAEEARAAEEDARARRLRSGGGGGRARPNTLEARMDRAIRGSLAEELRGVTGVSRGDAGRLDVPEDPADAERRRLLAIDQRNAQANRRRGGTLGDMLDERQAARERRLLEQRLDALQSFTDRWSDLHHAQVDVTREAVELIDSGLRGLSRAVAQHARAISEGAEDAEQGARAIVAATAGAFAEDSYAKAGFYAAEALAALVRYDFPGAGTAAAASVAYLAAGATFGAISGAVAPPAPAASSAGGRSAPGGGAQSVAPRGGSKTREGGTVINLNFGGPVVGGSPAQIGRELGRYLNTATAQTGFQLVPGAVGGGRR